MEKVISCLKKNFNKTLEDVLIQFVVRKHFVDKPFRNLFIVASAVLCITSSIPDVQFCLINISNLLVCLRTLQDRL